MEVLTWNYKEIRNFATSIIYAPHDLEIFDQHLTFPLKRQALLESLARRFDSLSHPVENGNFQNLFNKETFESLSRSFFDKLFSGFMKFGTICAGILGIISVAHLFKVFLDILVDGYALYTIYGWSFKLFAIFSSITNLLILKSRSKPSKILC